MAGIICIETEWQITKKTNRRNLNSESLMQFMSHMYGIPYLYRRVATLGELKYYLGQLQKREYDKYNIIYLSFHGQTHEIQLEGEKEGLTLNSLLEIGGSVFENRFVHFSSCRTLLGSQEILDNFKKESGASVVSGYSKSVESDISAIHDIALFGQFLTRHQMPAVFKNLEKLYGGLSKELGFRYKF